MRKLSNQGMRKVNELLNHAYEIFNAFGVGQEGEAALLRLRDEVQARLDSVDDGTSTMKVELPVRLLGYMMAASKHLGDMCLQLSQMEKAGLLFKR